ncbi:8-amino-7-oxononanoate synthase [Xylariaceae sp. FL0255]|nr:8-amino-7-oxononanoate synthase [Xylariaceae sp. FL0255]
MYAQNVMKEIFEDFRVRGSSVDDQEAFYRNIERALDARRKAQYLIGLKPQGDKNLLADFTTCDFLSLSRSGRVREAFLAELARHPDFNLSASGSRVQYGNYDYINVVEQEIADFHGAETAYITQSGFAANVAVLAGVPLPGDAVVYDEFVHASTHEGLHLSLAAHKLSFRHNDPDALREVLVALKSEYPVFVQGTKSILICVETIYSMDGDICPLQELVQVAKEEYPLGNAQFVVDEAHSLGVIGDKGRGLVSLLGLEKDIAIRIHVAGKALGSVGGMVLCNKTIRYALLNNSRCIIYSCAPSFPMVASIRVGYQLLMRGETSEAQQRIQDNVNYFYNTITADPFWDEAVESGILSVPLFEDWAFRDIQSHIVPLHTPKAHHEHYLFHALISNDLNAYPMAFPVVPKGESRIRLVFHAHNTYEEIEKLIITICNWAREMHEINRGGKDSALPSATRLLYEK